MGSVGSMQAATCAPMCAVHWAGRSPRPAAGMRRGPSAGGGATESSLWEERSGGGDLVSVAQARPPTPTHSPTYSLANASTGPLSERIRAAVSGSSATGFVELAPPSRTGAPEKDSSPPPAAHSVSSTPRYLPGSQGQRMAVHACSACCRFAPFASCLASRKVHKEMG